MPGFLVWLAIDIVLALASHFIAKRLPVGKTDPGSVEPPSADTSRSIPVVWGTAKVQPNVTWWGTTSSQEFTEKGQHAGYTYYATMAMGVCWGPIDALVDIIFDNKRSIKAVTGGVTPTLPRNITGTGLGEDYSINAPNLFGGAKKEGGVRGLIGFYYGTEAQTVDTFLNQQTQTGGPLNTEGDHKRLCYAVFKFGGVDRLNFYWGTTPAIKPVHFVVRRCPSALNGTGTATIGGWDANPAEIIYEILTDTWWGLKVATTDIDTASFQTCANTLFTEGFGISLVAADVPAGHDTIQEVLRYVDGAVYTDPVTGKIRMDLVRKDYVEGNLPVVNSSNGHSFEFSRPTYRELATGVKLKFTNRNRNFQEDVVDWQNQATLEVIAEESIQEIDMVGITDPATAQKTAFRVGKAVTMPFARCQFRTTRTAFNWVKAKAFMLQVPEESIGPLVMRVVEIDYGSLEEGEITISAIEDVFFTGIPGGGVYQPPVIGIDSRPPDDGSVIPQSIDTVTLTTTQGTLDMDLLDPNSKVTAVDVRTTTGTGTPTAWVTWPSPYLKTVTRLVDADINIEYRLTYTGPDGATDTKIVSNIIDRLGTGYAPVLDIQLTDSTWNTVTYTVTSTTPEGLPVTIYWALGDDPFATTVANGGTVTVLRSTNASDDRLLRFKAVAGNGQYEIRNVLVDYDATPELVTVSEASPVFNGNVQTGWKVKGTVDDDTRAIIVSTTGSIVAAPDAGSVYTTINSTTFWEDTTITKTFEIIITQSIGQSGVLTITPREFYNTANGGVAGQQYVVTISRPAVTVATILTLLTTVREIQLSANPSTATIFYRIGFGGPGTGSFSQYPPPNPPLTVDVELNFAVLEFYSVTTAGIQEEIRRVVIDQNDQPGIVSHTLIEDGANNALLALGFDDDVVRWTAWARRGQWPTKQSVTDPNTWIPDEIFLRYAGGIEQTSINWRASGSSATWYVIVRAYDKHGSYDEWSGTFVTSVAQVGALSNVSGFRNTETGVTYHDITWNNNSVVETGDHTVRVFENGIQLIASRDARWEHNTTSNGTANFGGYHIGRAFANAGDPGAVFLEYSYSVELWKTSTSSLVNTYSAAISGWYPGTGGGGGGGSPPSQIPNTPTTVGISTGVRATWTNTTTAFPVHIWWETSTTLGGTYTLASEQNLSAGVTTHDFTGTGVYARCKVRYYNDAGNGTYSSISNASTAIYVPTEIPSNVNAQGAAGYVARAAWTNTTSLWDIEAEFWIQVGGVGSYVFDTSKTATAGSTATTYTNPYTPGDRIEVRARYTNGSGVGEWSGFSTPILMHA